MTEYRATVEALWKEILGSGADPGADFIRNGGDSFKAAVFSVRLLEQADCDVNYYDVLSAPDLAALVTVVERSR
jgi:hypothetical protein